MASGEAMKLYEEVWKISNKDVSLVSVRNHTQNTLNTAIETKNKVVEMKMSLENIPIPDMIHLSKQTTWGYYIHWTTEGYIQSVQIAV